MAEIPAVKYNDNRVKVCVCVPCSQAGNVLSDTQLIADDATINLFHSPSKDGILTNNCNNSGVIQDAFTKTLCLRTNKCFVNELN